MNSNRRIAAVGAVMLAIVGSGWAADPQSAPSSVPPSSPVMLAPPGSAGAFAPGGSALAEPGRPGNPSGGANAAGRPSPFSAEISADFIRKVMETSAKIEEAKRQIADRQAMLYATNPEIKSTRTLMIEKQKEINRILDADQELAELKMSRDIVWSIMPALPKGQNPALMPRMPMVR
jgi:hypothetical protein